MAATTPDNSLAPEVVEGRIMAHRTVLAMILSHLQRDGGAMDLIAQLDSLSIVQDQQEDPGADMTGVDLVQMALADEIAATVLAATPDKLLAGEAG